MATRKPTTAKVAARKKPTTKRPAAGRKPSKPTPDAFDALHARRLEVLDTQLAAGLDIEVRSQGYTLLLLASKLAFRAAFDRLLAAGADVQATLPTGHNALHLVIEHTKNRPMNFAVTVTRKGKKQTLTDRDAIRKTLGSHPDDEYDDCVAIARALIANKIAVDHSITIGQTPLMFAASYGSVEILELLLATRRVDLNHHDDEGLTPLHWAARNGHLRAARTLLAAGADPDVVESYGFTPLHEAAENDRADVASALLAAGANPKRALTRAFAPYPVGATARDVAKHKQHAALAKLLG